MKRALLISLLLALGGGCKKKPLHNAAYLDHLDALTQQMCACQSRTCAEAVQKDVLAAGSEIGKDGPEPFTEAQSQHMNGDMLRIANCATQAMVNEPLK